MALFASLNYFLNWVFLQCTIMATIRFYIWSAAAAAAVAVSGCAGDDHGRENDRFVYV